MNLSWILVLFFALFASRTEALRIRDIRQRVPAHFHHHIIASAVGWIAGHSCQSSWPITSIWQTDIDTSYRHSFALAIPPLLPPGPCKALLVVEPHHDPHTDGNNSTKLVRSRYAIALLIAIFFVWPSTSPNNEDIGESMSAHLPGHATVDLSAVTTATLLVAKRARPLITDGDPDPPSALEHVRPLLVDAGTSMDEVNVRDGPQADIALAICIAAMLLATQAQCYVGSPALPPGRSTPAAMLPPASAVLAHARPALVDVGVSPAPSQTAYASTGLDAPHFAEIAVGPGFSQTADAGSQTWSPQQVASSPNSAAAKRRSINIALLTGRAAQIGDKSPTRLLRRRATVVDTTGGRAQVVATTTANTDDPAMGFTLSLKHANRLSWIDSPPSDQSTLSPAASSPLPLAASSPAHSPVSSTSSKGKEVEVAADAANFFPEETALELARAKAPLSAVYASTEQCAVAAATRSMLVTTAPDRAAPRELLKPAVSLAQGSPALVCRSLESACTKAFRPDQPRASAFFFREQVSASSPPLAIIADSRFVEETEYDSDSTSVVDYRQPPSVNDSLALGGGSGGTGKLKDKLRAPLLRVKASISSLAGSKGASLREPVDRVSTTSLSPVKTVVRKMSRLVRPTSSGSAASKSSKHIVAEPSSFSPSPSSSTWRHRKSKVPRSHSDK